MVKRRNKELYSKIFFLAIIAAIVVISFLIIEPFITAILSGAIIAYLFYPLYRRFGSRIKNENVRAFLISIILVLIVTVPSMVILSMLAKEAYATYSTIEQHKLGSNFMDFICSNGENKLCSWTLSFLSFLPKSDLNYYMRVIIEKITSAIAGSISKFLVALPIIMLDIVIVLFVVFYLLKDGKRMVERISKVLPLSSQQKAHVFRKFDQITRGVFLGNLAVAGIQGLAGGLGFLFLGLSSPLLWGSIMAVLALLPYFGTAIVWLPAALNLIILGNLTGNNSLTVKGVILIFYGIFIISTIDNILKPKIIGSKADIHPLPVLLGVLGGLQIFGIMGFIIGPILLSLLLVLIDIYEHEIDSEK